MTFLDNGAVWKGSLEGGFRKFGFLINSNGNFFMEKFNEFIKRDDLLIKRNKFNSDPTVPGICADQS